MVYASQIEVCGSRAVLFLFPLLRRATVGSLLRQRPALNGRMITHVLETQRYLDGVWTCERGVGLPAANLVWRGVGVEEGGCGGGGCSATVEMRVIWCGHGCFRTGRGPDAEEESLPRIHPFILSQLHFWEDEAACTIPEVGMSRPQESQRKPQRAVWNKEAESKRGWKCEAEERDRKCVLGVGALSPRVNFHWYNANAKPSEPSLISLTLLC